MSRRHHNPSRVAIGVCVNICLDKAKSYGPKSTHLKLMVTDGFAGVVEERRLRVARLGLSGVFAFAGAFEGVGGEPGMHLHCRRF